MKGFMNCSCFFQDGEHALEISELEEQATSQAKLINTLKTEQTELKSGLNDMSKELEIKVNEILRIRSEANQALK